MGKPVTEDHQLMAELVAKYMDEAMADPELFAFAVAHGVVPPVDIEARDKRSLFAVRFPPGSDTGVLEWDWWSGESDDAETRAE